MASLKQVAKIILQDCFNLKKNESVLIITDKNKRKIADIIFEEAQKKAKCIMLQIKPGKVNGEEPEKIVAEIMKKADVIIAATTKSISHTKARVDACKKGARMATLPGITEAMFRRAIALNYKDMKTLTLKLKKLLDKSNTVIIKTKLGTDIRFSIKGRKSIPDYGDISKKGTFDNLPSGECFIAPIEDSANGILFIDACMGTGKLKEAVKIEVKKGNPIIWSQWVWER